MTAPSGSSSRTALLVRAGARTCALPIGCVVETMRPLPVVALPGAPPFVAGAAVVRGEPVPVVDLDALLGGAGAPATRFVTVRAAGRVTALAVGAVLGVHPLPDGVEARPLAGAAAPAAVEALGARDRDLLVLLSAAQLVPDDVHAAARESGVPA